MTKRFLKHTTGLLCLLLLCICAAGCTDQSQPAEIAATGDTVQVDYKGYLDDGEVFDSSYEKGAPLTFVIGSGQMIPGFDAAVKGMAAGEKKTVRLSPAEAYGESNEALVMTVDKNIFSENTTPQIGESYSTLTDQGYVQFTIVAVNESDVSIDLNPPLAGKILNFDIELIAINPTDV